MTTTTLKPVKRAAKGHNRFCGPAALSIIAGVDTAEAAAVIRHVSRKRSVTGTSNWEILRSLALLGFKATSAAKLDPLNLKSNPTLAAWLKSDERDGQSLYLIAAGYHWQVVQGRRFCCGITKDIVSIRDEKVKRRARVSGVWKIEHERKVALADVLPIKLKVQKDDRAKAEEKARREAKRLAKAHDIEIEVNTYGHGPERDVSIIVWGPDFRNGEDDPFEGDHYADDWADALERVAEYVKLINANPELVG
jgi:hypothetical protein